MSNVKNNPLDSLFWNELSGKILIRETRRRQYISVKVKTLLLANKGYVELFSGSYPKGTWQVVGEQKQGVKKE